MYDSAKTYKNRKSIIITLIVILTIVGCVIWYKELGTNNEIPKKATYVNNFLIRGEQYK